jgi:integrase
VIKLLSGIETNHGPSMADAVLATIRSVMNWYAANHNDYTSPIIKGMARDKREKSDKARTRTLDHIEIRTGDGPMVEWNDRGEIRNLWTACDEIGSFGALCQLLLLTAQRLRKVARMRFEDVADGIWTIRTEAREKGNAGRLRLPQIAIDIIAAQPRHADNPHIFPAEREGRPFNAFAQRKKELDAMLPKDLPHWTLHDLRRTARSLMARAGVADNIAERTLGHRIPGIQAVYNRHGYFEEKAGALQKLAALIDSIVHPEGNVVAIAERKR